MQGAPGREPQALTPLPLPRCHWVRACEGSPHTSSPPRATCKFRSGPRAGLQSRWRCLRAAAHLPHLGRGRGPWVCGCRCLCVCLGREGRTDRQRKLAFAPSASALPFPDTAVPGRGLGIRGAVTTGGRVPTWEEPWGSWRVLHSQERAPVTPGAGLARPVHTHGFNTFTLDGSCTFCIPL